jgi:hypothetical protein
MYVVGVIILHMNIFSFVKKMILPSSGLGTLVENQLTVDAKAYFCTLLFYSIGPCIFSCQHHTGLMTAAL